MVSSLTMPCPAGARSGSTDGGADDRAPTGRPHRSRPARRRPAGRAARPSTRCRRPRRPPAPWRVSYARLPSVARWTANSVSPGRQLAAAEPAPPALGAVEHPGHLGDVRGGEDGAPRVPHLAVRRGHAGRPAAAHEHPLDRPADEHPAAVGLDRADQRVGQRAGPADRRRPAERRAAGGDRERQDAGAGPADVGDRGEREPGQQVAGRLGGEPLGDDLAARCATAAPRRRRRRPRTAGSSAPAFQRPCAAASPPSQSASSRRYASPSAVSNRAELGGGLVAVAGHHDRVAVGQRQHHRGIGVHVAQPVRGQHPARRPGSPGWSGSARARWSRSRAGSPAGSAPR